MEENSRRKEEELRVNKLPTARFWEAMDISQWEGFWFEPGLIEPAVSFRSTFQAHKDDVVLASASKTGTTWLKSLCLCITQQTVFNNINNVVIKNPQNEEEEIDIFTNGNPHFHIPTIEASNFSTQPLTDLYTLPPPRLFHTHLPYSVLPDSIKNSDCKIVYISRNPKDTLISLWHFFNSILRPGQNQDPYPLVKAVDCFCSGIHQYGPFFDHVLQYWSESQIRPEKILFLKYEDLQRDPKGEVKRLGSFLGRVLGDEEVENVIFRCSLERLKNLEVNKNGSVIHGVSNNLYFRRGVVGDWKNYLTPEMEERIDQVTRSKFEGSGLDFGI